MQQALDFFLTGIGVLSANTESRHFTGQLVQPQGGQHPLLGRHLAVTGDLRVQSSLRTHKLNSDIPADP